MEQQNKSWDHCNRSYTISELNYRWMKMRMMGEFIIHSDKYVFITSSREPTQESRGSCVQSTEIPVLALSFTKPLIEELISDNTTGSTIETNERTTEQNVLIVRHFFESTKKTVTWTSFTLMMNWITAHSYSIF